MVEELALKDGVFYRESGFDDMTGTYVSYHDSNRLFKKREVSYFHGNKEGPYVKYHKNGTVKLLGKYVNNRREGLWRKYHDDETLYKEGEYRDGIKVGEWRKYDKRGDVKSLTVYDDEGNLIREHYYSPLP